MAGRKRKHPDAECTCISCGEPTEPGSGVRCGRCKTIQRSNEKRRKETAIAAGLCALCKKRPHMPNSQRCRHCKDARKGFKPLNGMPSPEDVTAAIDWIKCQSDTLEQFEAEEGEYPGSLVPNSVRLLVEWLDGRPFPRLYNARWKKTRRDYSEDPKPKKPPTSAAATAAPESSAPAA